jgi:hypothetical protein
MPDTTRRYTEAQILDVARRHRGALVVAALRLLELLAEEPEK